MGFRQIILQIAVGKPRFGVVLDPLHAPRRQIRRRAQTWPFLEHLIGDIRDLEGHAGIFTIAPAANGEHLAAHLPDV